MNTVLFIDDDNISNFIHKKLAQNTVFAENVLISTSAVSALLLIKEMFHVKEPPLPEIIFLDLMMPVMDGFGFLTELEKLPEEISANIKVIVLTSSLNDDDFARAFKNKRVIDIIKKPLYREKLLEIKDNMQSS